MANKTLTHEELVVLVGKRLAARRTLQQVADEFAISVSTVRRLRDAGQSVKAQPASSNGKAKPANNNGKAVKAEPKAKPAKASGENTIAVVKANDLYRLLSDVQPFRGTDDTLPMLTGTHIESDGKRLLAATTDRFTLGISKLEFSAENCGIGGALGDVDFMLSVDSVAILLRTAKTAKRDIDWRLVTISKVGEVAAGTTVPTFTYRFAFFSGETINVKPFDVEFPKFKQLIPKGPAIPRASTAFTPAYLARFAKVENDWGQIVLFTFDSGEDGSRKPTLVRIGDNFIGMIMPVRLHDGAEDYSRPKWL